MATLVVEALQAALPLRRCSVRLGRTHQPVQGATPCAAAQLGVAACPCAGLADRRRYDDAVTSAVGAMTDGPSDVADRLTDRMRSLATAQRFEDAATTRDRLSALEGAVTRTGKMDRLLARGRFEVRRGDVTWVVDHARLVDVRVAGSRSGALPAAPPPAPEPGRPLPRLLADEALVLARRLPT
jgi:DNA polymerase-3 subunit epsilon